MSNLLERLTEHADFLPARHYSVPIIREAIGRIKELEEALQNISNGDTPWMDSDGCHTTPAEIYQKYAKQVLAQQGESPRFETKSPRFDNTYCSQCGSEFGPGDHGYSHCNDHRRTG